MQSREVISQKMISILDEIISQSKKNPLKQSTYLAMAPDLITLKNTCLALLSKDFLDLSSATNIQQAFIKEYTAIKNAKDFVAEQQQIIEDNRIKKVLSSYLNKAIGKYDGDVYKPAWYQIWYEHIMLLRDDLADEKVSERKIIRRLNRIIKNANRENLNSSFIVYIKNIIDTHNKHESTVRGAVFNKVNAFDASNIDIESAKDLDELKNLFSYKISNARILLIISAALDDFLQHYIYKLSIAFRTNDIRLDALARVEGIMTAYQEEEVYPIWYHQVWKDDIKALASFLSDETVSKTQVRRKLARTISAMQTECSNDPFGDPFVASIEKLLSVMDSQPKKKDKPPLEGKHVVADVSKQTVTQSMLNQVITPLEPVYIRAVIKKLDNEISVQQAQDLPPCYATLYPALQGEVMPCVQPFLYPSIITLQQPGYTYSSSQYMQQTVTRDLPPPYETLFRTMDGSVMSGTLTSLYPSLLPPYVPMSEQYMQQTITKESPSPYEATCTMQALTSTQLYKELEELKVPDYPLTRKNMQSPGQLVNQLGIYSQQLAKRDAIAASSHTGAIQQRLPTYGS